MLLHTINDLTEIYVKHKNKKLMYETAQAENYNDIGEIDAHVNYYIYTKLWITENKHTFFAEAKILLRTENMSCFHYI